jgi:hypothetical protein
MSHSEQNMLYKHMPDYQPLHHYEHFNFYSNSYETTSCLLPANTTPNTTHKSSKVICKYDICSSLNPLGMELKFPVKCAKL